MDSACQVWKIGGAHGIHGVGSHGIPGHGIHESHGIMERRQLIFGSNFKAIAKARGGGYGVRLGRALAGSRFASATPADAKGPAHAS